MTFDLFAAVAALAAIAGLVVSILVLRALHDPALAEDAEMLQRLGILVERDQSVRAGEAETARGRLAEIERVLVGRVEQNRHDMSERLGQLTTTIAREQGESRLSLANALREMSEQSAARLAEIQASVNEQLH